jgi:hypothetical protein
MSRNGGLVSVTRFTDAVYVKSENGSKIKEMYQLHGGPVLYRGFTASELDGISPFFMLDMPIGMVLSFLRHQFEQPCAVIRSETQFSYTLPAGNNMGIGVTNVKGNASRLSDTDISYEITATETKERGATMSMSGKIEFLAIRQLPINTKIFDWIIVRTGSATNPKRLIKPNKAFYTIGELKALDSFESKP